MKEREYHAMAELELKLWWYRALHDKVICSLRRMFPAIPDVTMLDAGCGTGGVLSVLSNTFPGWNLHGIDISEIAVEYARRISPALIRQGSVVELPYPDSSFDAIVSTDVMYHREVIPYEMLSECCRVLRDDGVLILNLPAYNWLRSYHDQQVGTARRYTLASLTSTIEKHPLQRIKVSYWNALLFLPLVIKRKLLAGREEHSDVHEIPAWLDAVFYTLMSWENAWICRGGSIPFGSSIFAVYKKRSNAQSQS